MRTFYKKLENGVIWKIEIDEGTVYEAVETVSGFRVTKTFKNIKVAISWLTGDIYDFEEKETTEEQFEEIKDGLIGYSNRAPIVKNSKNYGNFTGYNPVVVDELMAVLKAGKTSVSIQSIARRGTILGDEKHFLMTAQSDLSYEKGKILVLKTTTIISVGNKTILKDKEIDMLDAVCLIDLIKDGNLLPRETYEMLAMGDEDLSKQVEKLYYKYLVKDNNLLLDETRILGKINREKGITLEYDTILKKLKEFNSSDGFMVSLESYEMKINYEGDYDIIESIEGYFKMYENIFKTCGNKFLGVWIDEGTAYLDISVQISNLNEAMQVGIENKQLAIYDLSKGESIKLEYEEGDLI